MFDYFFALSSCQATKGGLLEVTGPIQDVVQPITPIKNAIFRLWFLNGSNK